MRNYFINFILSSILTVFSKFIHLYKDLERKYLHACSAYSLLFKNKIKPKQLNFYPKIVDLHEN